VNRVAIVLAVALLGIAAARADERGAAVVDAFKTSCLSELPNFARIDARAEAEHLPVNQEAGTPRQAEGFFNHLKSWLLIRSEGTYELSAVEARGPAGEVATCALAASDAPGDEVKQDLMKALDLGPPGREAVSPDGLRRSSAWYLQLQGTQTILLLIDASPTGNPGAYLNVTHRPAAGS